MSNENKAKLFMKIVKVMEEVGQIQKDRKVVNKNKEVMYEYLSEEAVTGALQRAFIKYKIVMMPVKVDSELIYQEITEYDKTKKMPITKLTVTYQLSDAETGEVQEIQSVGYGADAQDKGSNKAMTGAYKYAQRQTFSISTGDDPDHDGSAPGTTTEAKTETKTETPTDPKPEEPPKGNTYGPIPQTLRVKYKLFKGGSLDGLDAWIAGRREKGLDYAAMEAILTEGIEKKKKPTGETA